MKSAETSVGLVKATYCEHMTNRTSSIRSTMLTSYLEAHQHTNSVSITMVIPFILIPLIHCDSKQTSTMIKKKKDFFSMRKRSLKHLSNIYSREFLLQCTPSQQNPVERDAAAKVWRHRGSRTLRPRAGE